MKRIMQEKVKTMMSRMEQHCTDIKYLNFIPYHKLCLCQVTALLQMVAMGMQLDQHCPLKLTLNRV